LGVRTRQVKVYLGNDSIRKCFGDIGLHLNGWAHKVSPSTGLGNNTSADLALSKDTSSQSLCPHPYYKLPPKRRSKEESTTVSLLIETIPEGFFIWYNFYNSHWLPRGQGDNQNKKSKPAHLSQLGTTNLTSSYLLSS